MLQTRVAKTKKGNLCRTQCLKNVFYLTMQNRSEHYEIRPSSFFNYLLSCFAINTAHR